MPGTKPQPRKRGKEWEGRPEKITEIPEGYEWTREQAVAGLPPQPTPTMNESEANRAATKEEPLKIKTEPL